MPYELRDMSGSIFDNTRRDRDTSPNMTGTAMIFGKEVWVNAWVKRDKNGKEWISLAFKEKVPKPDYDKGPVITPSRDLDDSMPF